MRACFSMSLVRMKALALSAAVCAVAMMNLLNLKEREVVVVINQRVFDALPRRDVDEVLVDLPHRERELAPVVRAADEPNHAEDEAPVREVELAAHVLHQRDGPVPILKELDHLLLGGEWQIGG